MTIKEKLETADACLAKVSASGDELMALALARRLLKEIYTEVAANNGGFDNREP